MKIVYMLLALALLGPLLQEPSHAQSKPLPISVACRKSFLQGSYVLQIQNTSSESLQLWLQAKGKFTPFALPGGKMEEFGWAQGYRFDANNVFAISGENFDTLLQRMPNVELNPVKVDFSRDGGLAVSLSQSYLQERLPKPLKLPIRERASSSLEFSLNELPRIVLNDGSERIHILAILQSSLLSGRLRFPLKAGISFVPFYSPSTGEVVASQIQVEDIDINAPGSDIGLLPSDWREQATKTVNVLLPTLFSQFVIYKIQKKSLKDLLNAVNLRTKVIDGRLELIIL